MEQNNKLDNFKNAVFSEVDNKIFDMQRTAIENQEQLIKDNKERLDLYKKETINTKTQKIQNDYKKESSKFAMEQKRRILLKREELIEKMLGNLKDTFIEFTKTDDYKKYLTDKLTIISQNNSLDNVNILVSKSDFKYKADLEKAYKLKCEIKTSDDILIGGFAIQDLNRNIYFDETIDSKLSDKKAYLIQNSGLYL